MDSEMNPSCSTEGERREDLSSVLEDIEAGAFNESCAEFLGGNRNGSRVYKWEYHGKVYAVKCLPKHSSLKEEYGFHSIINKPNVVDYYRLDPRQDDLLVFQEWFNMTLEYFVQKCHFKGLKLDDLLKSITKGIEFLHGQDIIHGNLHPRNIFIHAGNNEAKIALSDYPSKTDSTEERFFLRDKQWTMATSQQLNKKCDIFSLGCILYYVKTKGKHPYGQVLEEREKLISRNLYNIRLGEDLFWTTLIELMVNIKFDGLTVSECLAFIKNSGEEKECEKLKQMTNDIERPRKTGEIILSESFSIANMDIVLHSGRFFHQYVNAIDMNEHYVQMEEDIEELRSLSSHSSVLAYMCCLEVDGSWKLVTEPLVDVLPNCYSSLSRFGYSKRSLLLEITEGLEFLHDHDVYHHQLIPENIVFVKKGEDFVVKIAKLPLENKFTSDMSTEKSHESLDIFQLGFLFHFVLSCGENISKLEGNDSYLLSSHLSYLEKHVIQIMIDGENQIPSVEVLLYHPFFWCERKTFDFLDALNNYLTENDVKETEQIKALNDICPSQPIPSDVLQIARNLSNFSHDQVDNYKILIELICLLGNKYNRLPEELRILFTSFPQGFCQYWTTLLPEFLLTLWTALQDNESLTQDDELEEFFYPDYKFTLHINTMDHTTNEVFSMLLAFVANVHYAVSSFLQLARLLHQPFESSSRSSLSESGRQRSIEYNYHPLWEKSEPTFASNYVTHCYEIPTTLTTLTVKRTYCQTERNKSELVRHISLTQSDKNLALRFLSLLCLICCYCYSHVNRHTT